MTEIIEIASDRFVCRLAADTPAAVEVPTGSTLRIACRSAADRLVGPGPVRAEGPNPATGPIAVAGARPGQVLVVEVLAVEPVSPGHVSAGPAGGVQAVEIADGAAHFHGIRIPLAPMVGVLGLAPPAGSWHTMGAGPWGGNLDTRDVAPGATVHLPIYQPGGRLVVGDVHAVMGDGEIGGQGLECAAAVTVRVNVLGRPLSDHVLLMHGGEVLVIGTGETLESAVDDAVEAAAALVARERGLDEFTARKFLGLAGHTRIGQHVCRMKTVRVAVPQAYLPFRAP